MNSYPKYTRKAQEITCNNINSEHKPFNVASYFDSRTGILTHMIAVKDSVAADGMKITRYYVNTSGIIVNIN